MSTEAMSSASEPASAVLLMGVSRFVAAVPADAEPEPGAHTWANLPFVDVLLPRLEAAYERLAYRTKTVVDPDRRGVLSSWDEALHDEYLVMHVISHGTTTLDDPRRSRAADLPQQLDFVPTCGKIGNGTDILQWVTQAHKRPLPMLFFVDLCRAGRSARVQQLTLVPDEELNAWVIAAASPQDPAYDGKFSEIVAEVLEGLADNGLDTASTLEFVKWERLVREIQRRLAAAGSDQKVHSTKIDSARPAPVLPFFRNPNYRPDPRREKIESITPPVRAFVADLDTDHFVARVGEHFVGRRSQLEELAPWLDDGTAGGLWIVTGAAGAGKSALLGALACAAHREIIEAAPEIRRYLAAQCPEGTPSPNDGLAAIHARGRHYDTVTASLAAQWGLPDTGEPWTVTALIEGLVELEATPALIFDALDEALDPALMARELLVPLADARRPDGGRACRIVIGSRRGKALQSLVDLVSEAQTINLDHVDQAELHQDLKSHLMRVLADLPAYEEPSRRRVRSALAGAIADALTADETTQHQWGAFLVARIFGRSLALIDPATDEAAAAALGASAPRSLPDVFELDLGLRADSEALRAVLAAVAWAKGPGFPTDAVAAVAPEFDSSITEQNVRQLLDAGRFYLRTEIDTDGAVLYRLFHQGLADYLKKTSYGTGADE